MSLAAETRRAVDHHPFLLTALRAGVVNYTAAARYLEVDGEIDAIATALRRYADELPDHETESRDVRVRMESGIGPLDDDRTNTDGDDGDGTEHRRGDALLTVGGTDLGPGGGEGTAIVATGDVDTTALAETLARLSLEDVASDAAAVSRGTMVVVVDRRDGANALRAVEAALERVRVGTAGTQ